MQKEELGTRNIARIRARLGNDTAHKAPQICDHSDSFQSGKIFYTLKIDA